MRKKATSLSIILVILGTGVPLPTHAGIALEKSAYEQGQPLRFISSGGPYVIYDITDNALIEGQGSYTKGDMIDFGATVIGHEYVFVETSVDGICEDPPISYSACKSLPAFVGEFVFRIVAPSTATSPTKIAYRPEVTIVSPKKGGSLGRLAKITYEVTDENDKNLRNDKADLGLGPTPVTIYHFDPADRDNRQLLARDLPPAGTYEWDTKDIEEGTYGLAVVAVDLATERDEEIVEEFNIDKSPPVFKVKADPVVTRGEDVKIIVDASEDLAEAPRIEIKQKGFRAFPVNLKGEKTHFEGTYQVIKGYDGPATISVVGKDVAGNEGSTIISGGRFSVGIEPPPKPVISSPLDQDIVSSETITITGKMREDTKAILLVNGTDSYEAEADEQGNFKFENVKLSSEFNNGVNFLSITSRDGAGNVSESAIISIKFNLSPEISFLSPQKGSVLSGTVNIRVEAKDKNRDKLGFTYEASSDGGANWTVLAENITSKAYAWNTANLPNGEYLLRVTADDGVAKVQVISEKFTLNNFVPIITFTDGERTVVGKTEVVISGTVVSPEGKEERMKLTGLEYSQNSGRSWLPVSAQDGVFDGFEEKFSLPLNNLVEKLYTIQFRSPGAGGVFGQATKTLIVDFGPPAAPQVLIPQASSILGDQDDTNPNLAGVQFSVSGNAEAGSTVSVAVDDALFKGQTNDRGVFEVAGTTLRTHGQNQLRVFATDLAGNKGQETSLLLVYNNPPHLKFLNPRPGRGLSRETEVRWEIQDPDLDPVKDVTLSYRAGNAAFQRLASNPRGAGFTWDVSRLAEGKNYELKLGATDGVSSAEIIREFFIDNTPPRIIIEPLKQTAFRKAFTLEASGRAVENFSEIEFIEYSVDGRHWFKALITGGYLEKQTNFKVRHPFELKDGEYEISFRALDTAGNLSAPAVQKLRIDSIPPRIGSFTISQGNLILFPLEGAILVPEGSPVDFKISLEEDAREANLTIGGRVIGLTKNTLSNLWETEIKINELGRFGMTVQASDALGNQTPNREIGFLEIIKRGKISGLDPDSGSESIEEATVTVLVFDEENKNFTRWQAESFGADNPAVSRASGEYDLLLPAGRYQLVVQKAGFSRLKSSEFNLEQARFVTFDFQLKKREGLPGFLENLLERFR